MRKQVWQKSLAAASVLMVLVVLGCNDPTGSSPATVVPPPIPVHTAVGVSFIDTDQTIDEVGGTVNITKATDESDIDYYVLYWGTAPNSINGAAIAEIPKTGSNLTYAMPANTTLSGNSYLIVRTRNSYGEMASGVSWAIQDLIGVPPVNKATSVSFTDTDAYEGKVGGTVSITMATDEIDITAYVLYWGSDATTINGAAIAELPATGTDLTYTIAAGTPLSVNTHLIVLTKNSNGEMAAGVNTAIVDLATIKYFWAYNTNSGAYYQTLATLQAEGSSCKIFVENASAAQVADAAAIATEFDTNVYGLITTDFAPASDVNGDGKITILILDIKDGFTGSGGYVAGYFDSRNDFDMANSNKCDMLYMDCNPGIPGNSTFNSTMAHELQHLVNYNEKVLVQKTSGQDTWINEGLSSAAEYLYAGSQIQSRINDYNADSDTLISQGVYFLSWFGELANYATDYLFFQWLRIHASNGKGIYKEIIANSSGTYLAVQSVATARISGLSGTTWKDILRDWFAANLFNDQTSSTIYGYGGEIPTLVIHSYAQSDSTWFLYPGEGIYVGISTPASMTPSGYIDYAGLDSATNAIDTLGSSYAGDYLLCYNFNGTPSTSKYETTGTLPALVSSPLLSASYQQAVSAAAANLPKIYPMDPLFDRDGPRHGNSGSRESLKKPNQRRLK